MGITRLKGKEQKILISWLLLAALVKITSFKEEKIKVGMDGG